MAIAYDTSSEGGALGASPFSWNHTVTGSNAILFVQSYETGTSQRTSGVTYNGNAMTSIAYQNNGSDRGLRLWYILIPSPDGNAHSITVTSSEVTSGSAVSYTGVNQSGQPDSFANSAPSGVTATQATTVVASNCWLVGTFMDVGFATSTAGTGTTLRVVINNANPWGQGAMLDSNGTVGTGSQSLQATNTYGSDVWAVVVASFKPVATAGPANLKSLDTNVTANIKSYNTNLIANVKSIDTNA